MKGEDKEKPTGSTHRVSLGNYKPKPISQLELQRKTFYENSTRNSFDAPGWMQRTSNYYRKDDSKNPVTIRKQSVFSSARQTYVYKDVSRDANRGSQYQIIQNKKIRNKWELSDHTFRFSWPKKQTSHLVQIEKKSANPQQPFPNLTHNNFLPTKSNFYPHKIEIPKYALTLKSPLYRQKPTIVKIGHENNYINSTYVK